jgi:hypothetical protein
MLCGAVETRREGIEELKETTSQSRSWTVRKKAREAARSSHVTSSGSALPKFTVARTMGKLTFSFHSPQYLPISLSVTLTVSCFPEILPSSIDIEQMVFIDDATTNIITQRPYCETETNLLLFTAD